MYNWRVWIRLLATNESILGGVKMFELSITRIKYPKNDTITYVYNSLDSLLMELKQMVLNKKISNNDILRIKESD